MPGPLAICETHPVQYHAPVYQALARLGVDFEVVYGSDFSVQGYRDKEFQSDFAWDTDLLGGYRSRFIKRVADGGPGSYEDVPGSGIASVLKELQPKFVMCLGYSVAFDKGAIEAARRMSVPLLLRTEASDVALQRNRIKALLRDWFLRKLYKHCQQLLYVGQNNLAHYRRLGVPESKLEFSPYCVNTAPFQCDLVVREQSRAASRQSLGIAADELCLMYCGKLSKRKGVDLLLAACKRLPESLQKRVVLLYVGEGVLRSQLEEASRQSPSVKLIITGFKNQRELSPYYHAADLAILPSITSETWGLVVNEALHHGVPCLVSDRVGCAADLIETDVTGSVFAAKDVEALSRCITNFVPRIGDRVSRDCQRKIEPYSLHNAAMGIQKALCKLGGK